MDDETYETSFDIALDDEPAAPRKPVFVDAVVKREDTRLPIIPASFRTWDNVRSTLRYHGGLLAYRAAAHSWRAVLIYLPLMLFWSVIGLFRLLGRQVRWWWVTEQFGLRQAAATDGDYLTWSKATREARAIRLFRGLVLLAELVALVVAVVVLAFQPRWVTVLVVVTALPWLAHLGRPIDRPIIRPVLVTERLRRLNADIVLRAYYVAKLGNPDKPDQEVTFPGTMSRDAKDTGSQVDVDMPFGKTFAEAMAAKEKIASGLDVHVNQVFLTKGDRERRHQLFVADHDPLAIPVGRTDMLDCKPRNIWEPMKLGRDERDQLVTLMLLWNSLLIGAMPRRGKTFFVRLILLYAALDPWVKIYGADGKKSSDYDKLRLVAHRWVVGDAPNPRDNDPLQHFEDMLDELLADIAETNEVLSSLPVEMCPEGKLTEALARDPRYPMLRVRVVVGEEFQVYFETEDQKYNIRIANKWGRIMAQGPSAGVILADSSQKPSGVGAGDVSRLFNRFRDNHQVRFALRCGNRVVSEAVLGGDAYAEGYDASALPIGDGSNGTKDYRGVGILYGASDRTPTVRTFLADHADAERILIAAREHRERMGLLTGAAAGIDMSRERRDFLRDVESVFYAGEAWVSWQSIADRLAQQIPEHYADITKPAVSAQVRDLGAKEKKGRDEEGASVWGVPHEQVVKAIESRQIKGAG